jgi:hypothetical protein
MSLVIGSLVTRDLVRGEVNMTPMNPAMVEMVARARVGEMRQVAAKRSSGVRELNTVHARRVRLPTGRTRSIRPAAPRRAIGYFLINLGLRLALPMPNVSAR